MELPGTPREKLDRALAREVITSWFEPSSVALAVSLAVTMTRASLPEPADENVLLRVVDVGCGAGAPACLLASQGCQVVALDLSASALGLARHVIAAHEACGAPWDTVRERVALLQADYLEDPDLLDESHPARALLPAGHFDLVFDKGTLDAVGIHSDRSRTTTFLQRSARLLRAGGTLCVMTCAFSLRELEDGAESAGLTLAADITPMLTEENLCVFFFTKNPLL